jgi:hypothetical protein
VVPEIDVFGLSIKTFGLAFGLSFVFCGLIVGRRLRELAAAAPDCRYVEVPGGHHRSVQHDAELTGVSVRFVLRALRRGAGPALPPAA